MALPRHPRPPPLLPPRPPPRRRRHPRPSPPRKPTPAPTATPAASTAANLGGFAFPAAQVLAYYESVGFKCEDPTASTQATGYTLVRCLNADAATGFTTLVAVVVDPDGVTGDAFAGVVGSDGKTKPTPQQALEGLSFFLGAMLGETNGLEAGTWLANNIGEEMVQTKVNDMLVATYPGDKDKGLGYYVEVANQAFLTRPFPDGARGPSGPDGSGRGPAIRAMVLARTHGVRSPRSLARGLTVWHLTLDQGVLGSNPSAPANSFRECGAAAAHAACPASHEPGAAANGEHSNPLPHPGPDRLHP